MPTLSVIVPLYNVQNYLDDCVQSILSQSYRDLELLLVDDGSTDGSAALCDGYAQMDGRVKVFHKTNGGVSSARNVGLEHMRGEFLIFADADDWFASDAFSKLMQDAATLSDLTFYGSIFHYADHEEQRSPGNHSYSDFLALQHGLLHLAYNKDCPDYIGFTWNKLFRASIIREHGLRFVEGLSIREDEVFTLSYASFCSTMQVLPDRLYHYRKLPCGLTVAKKSSDELRLLACNYMQLKELYSEEELKEYIRRQMVKFLLSAVRISAETKIRNNIIDELWRNKNKQEWSLPVKFLYRFFLSVSSPVFLRWFMSARFFFYSLKS